MQAIPCPISRDELERLYTVEKLTDAQVAEDLGNGATVKRVRSWRRRLGIATLNRAERNEVTPIEGKLRSLLVGSMLGDGRLVRRVHATHYQECHMEGQRAYLEWKVKLWGPWVKMTPKPVTWEQQGKTYRGVRFHTCAHASLNEWRDLFYENRQAGWKRLIPKVVDLVDEFALMVWYLDDGYAGWWPGIVFGADEASRQIACSIFEKFDLHPRWQPKKDSTGEFHMEREETAERFLSLIRPHISDCLPEKFHFGYDSGRNNRIKKRLDPHILQQMVDSGFPIRRMARELEVGASTVDRYLKRYDIDHPRLKGNPNHRKDKTNG